MFMCLGWVSVLGPRILIHILLLSAFARILDQSSSSPFFQSEYTIIPFQIGKDKNVLDLMKHKLIHEELLMVTNMVHFPPGHNYIKKTITTSCNESLMVKYQEDTFKNASNMLAVKSID